MLMIRADAGSTIGAGHMMRCMTIARAYVSAVKKDTDLDDSPVLFVCANEDSALLPCEAGFPVHVLNTNPEDLKNELPVLLPVLGEFNAKTLLVDSYRVTDAYLSALSKVVPVFYMDDFGNHTYPVQGIINYNFYADETAYETLYSDNLLRVSRNLSAGPEKTISLTSDTASVPSPDMTSHHQISAATPIALLGPAYAPVREEFSNVSFAVSEKVRNILILCGGGGDGSLPLRIYETLSKECDSGITWHIVLGKYAADNLPADSPLRLASYLICHFDVKNMAALMESCDLCITAGGSTVYELCAVGLPFVTFSMADNQNENCRYLDTHGIADFAGSMETEPDRALANLSKSVQRLSADYSLRQEKSIQLKTLVDDGGARRIAAAMRGTL